MHMLAEGELDSGAAREITDHLGDCPSCAEKLEEFTLMKARMEETLSATLTAPDVADIILDGSRVLSKRSGYFRSILRWACISMATAAGLLVLVVTGYLYSRGFIGPKPVAGRLTHVSVSDGEWKKGGGRIRGMKRVITEARERRSLRLNNGVIVILNEKTGLEVQSENSLRLLNGEIYVDTAGRKGLILRIKTDHATTFVTGTKLGVSRGKDKTSVIVEEGKVSVESGWGEQVVIRGNIYRIIKSMKPEPPEPIDIEETFYWVRERAYLAGMMIDIYDREFDEPTDIDQDEDLLDQLLYGLEQSRQAVWSGDISFEVTSVSYGFGYDLTEEEQEEYIEHVVAGQIAQLDTKERPNRERFREIVEAAVDSATVKSETHSSETSEHWIFSQYDGARVKKVVQDGTVLRTDMIVNDTERYWPAREIVEHSDEGFVIDKHPAYFGRSYLPVSELANPRLLRMEAIDGVETYVLEADLEDEYGFGGDPKKCIIQLWIDPSRGYVVLKTRKHVGVVMDGSLPLCIETVAESFEDIYPGVFYPRVFIRRSYPGDMVSGELVLRKTGETVYTLYEEEFNIDIPDDVFDIPADLPVTEVDEKRHQPPGSLEGQVMESQNDEYLQGIYDELEQIKLHDDPAWPGNRKLILTLDGEKLEDILRNRGGVIYTGAYRNGQVIGVYIIRVDPPIAADVPFLKGDTIYTLNDEPWLVYGPTDWIRGLESCIPIVNAGKPITAGVRRNGQLTYVIIWID